MCPSQVPRAPVPAVLGGQGGNQNTALTRLPSHGMISACNVRPNKTETFTRRLPYLSPFLLYSLAHPLCPDDSISIPFLTDHLLHISCLSLTGLPLSLSLWLSILPSSARHSIESVPFLSSARHSNATVKYRQPLTAVFNLPKPGRLRRLSVGVLGWERSSLLCSRLCPPQWE